MKKSISYHDDLIESLKDPEEASAYLSACLQEALEHNEMRIFHGAIRNVVEARGGMAKISKKMHAGYNSLYKSFAPDAKPRFSTILYALKACGLELDFHQAQATFI